jgi:hypothetical protein
MPAAGPRQGDRPGLALLTLHSSRQGNAAWLRFLVTFSGQLAWRGAGGLAVGRLGDLGLPDRQPAPLPGPGVGAVRLWVGMVVAAAAWMP